MLSRTLLVLFFSVLLLGTFGCEKEGPAERAGAKLDDAVEDSKDSVEDAVEEAGDRIEEAGDAIENKTQ